MSRWSLIRALFSKNGGVCVTLKNGTKIHGILNAIQRESGGGNDFNISVMVDGVIIIYYIKTHD